MGTFERSLCQCPHQPTVIYTDWRTVRGRGPVIEMHLNHLLSTPFLSAKRCLSVTASVCDFIMFFSTMFLKKERKSSFNDSNYSFPFWKIYEWTTLLSIWKQPFSLFCWQSKKQKHWESSLEQVLQHNRRNTHNENVCIAVHSLLSFFCTVEENSYLIHHILHPGFFFNDVVWKWMNKGPLRLMLLWELISAQHY